MAQAVLIIVGTFFDGLFKGFTDQKRLVVRTGPGPRKFRNSWTKSDRSVPRRGWSVDPCLFLCLIFLYFLKKKLNMSHNSIMSPHEVGKRRLKNRDFWKLHEEKFKSLEFQLRISRHKTLQFLNFSNLSFQLQVSPMMNTGYNCRYFCWTRDWSFDKSWWISSTSYYLYDIDYIIYDL